MRSPALRLPLLALILSMYLSCATFGQEISSGIFHLKPQRPIAELRSEALRASPPQEAGEFRRPELVELIKIDSTIRLDIRYATSDNFLSTPLYSQARAFLQRPAAEALARVNQKLHASGYGLLIHDAYRPWYVTKMFWEATPEDKKVFVADPAVGSKHNRGCAVDLSMYELSNGKEVAMPSVYDEMTPRAFAKYPGGTTGERQHRATLRQAMESEGFQIYPQEWWHFDYRDWKEYPIMNVRFEELGNSSRSALQRMHTARSQ
jgi:zinc D-Ala-D-Ala dipeptidase